MTSQMRLEALCPWQITVDDLGGREFIHLTHIQNWASICEHGLRIPRESLRLNIFLSVKSVD